METPPERRLQENARARTAEEPLAQMSARVVRGGSASCCLGRGTARSETGTSGDGAGRAPGSVLIEQVLYWQETFKKTTAAEAAGKVDAAWSRAQPLANAAGVNGENEAGALCGAGSAARWKARVTP